MTPQEAERWLLGRELFGMDFGLGRIEALVAALGVRVPDAVHVVGTNGKSSTVRMTSALLEREGLRTGSFLSPHLVSFAERIRLGDRDLDPGALAVAVGAVARAAEEVDRRGHPVTQFEALTAAALVALGRAGVDAAVIEAGLGGRLDATNVVDARVVVLTNVGLEHTRWLGDTIAEIAREKLAVLGDGATLVVGAGLHPDAGREAQRAVARHDARLVHAPDDPGIELAAQGAFQRRNFATARAAAEAFLGRPADEAAVRAAAASVLVPGRFQVVGHDPLTVLDGAHNPAGMAALAASLPRGRRLVAVLSVLEDKDAGRMLAALLPLADELVLTTSANPRALAPEALRALAGRGETEADPHRALERARALAGAGGMVLATGSIYLVADLLRRAGSTVVSAL